MFLQDFVRAAVLVEVGARPRPARPTPRGARRRASSACVSHRRPSPSGHRSAARQSIDAPVLRDRAAARAGGDPACTASASARIDTAISAGVLGADVEPGRAVDAAQVGDAPVGQPVGPRLLRPARARARRCSRRRSSSAAASAGPASSSSWLAPPACPDRPAPAMTPVAAVPASLTSGSASRAARRPRPAPRRRGRRRRSTSCGTGQSTVTTRPSVTAVPLAPAAEQLARRPRPRRRSSRRSRRSNSVVPATSSPSSCGHQADRLAGRRAAPTARPAGRRPAPAGTRAAAARQAGDERVDLADLEVDAGGRGRRPGRPGPRAGRRARRTAASRPGRRRG